MRTQALYPNKNKSLLLTASIFAILTYAYIFYIVSICPDTMILQFGGDVDRYGPKYEILFSLFAPAVVLALVLVSYFSRNILEDSSGERSPLQTNYLLCIFAVVFSVLIAAILGGAFGFLLGYNVSEGFSFSIGGLLLVIIGSIISIIGTVLLIFSHSLLKNIRISFKVVVSVLITLIVIGFILISCCLFF